MFKKDTATKIFHYAEDGYVTDIVGRMAEAFSYAEAVRALHGC